VHLDRVEPDGASEDAAAELGNGVSRLQEEPALQCARGNLDQAVRRQKAESSAHAHLRRDPDRSNGTNRLAPRIGHLELGSTTMVVRGETVNRPSDDTGDRANGDAILLFPRLGP